jgi:hypothetical protein
MMPCALRLLLAELPGHCGRQLEAMHRLLCLLRTVRELVDSQEAGRAVWREREVMVLHSLVNCAVMHQDFESAVMCLDMLTEVVEPEAEGPLHSAYGRLYLQLGSLPLADNNTNTKLGRANGNNIAVCLLIPVDVTVTDVSPAINSFIKV